MREDELIFYLSMLFNTTMMSSSSWRWVDSSWEGRCPHLVSTNAIQSLRWWTHLAIHLGEDEGKMNSSCIYQCYSVITMMNSSSWRWLTSSWEDEFYRLDRYAHGVIRLAFAPAGLIPSLIAEKICIFSIGRAVAPATRGRVFERQQEAINQYAAATLMLAANTVLRSIIFKLIK